MKTIEQMLEMIEDKKLKEISLKIYKDNVEQMKKMPASTKYHHSYTEGYHDHVQQIMYFGMRIWKVMNKQAIMTCTLDDVIFLCFIHDHDKLERYVSTGEVKSGKNEGKEKFGKKLDFTIDPYAKVCVMMAAYGLFLSDEHIHALTYQSGGWSEFAKWDSDMTNLATILHCADMLSSKITPTRENLKTDAKEDKD